MYGVKEDMKFTSAIRRRTAKIVTHWSKMAWQDNVRLGCGIKNAAISTSLFAIMDLAGTLLASTSTTSAEHVPVAQVVPVAILPPDSVHKLKRRPFLNYIWCACEFTVIECYICHERLQLICFFPPTEQ
ncbi:hypothetical protein ANCCAN_26390 [Ancylostoma caninum]|uniref:Uncharacterized protein n=1 Tax=Ancylostoma caninum TaxID=29170 RepID=A0A368F709_ANCCA|nr:hypothetical protein ANCCAN_26390 [Ancylostoma caninum]